MSPNKKTISETVATVTASSKKTDLTAKELSVETKTETTPVVEKTTKCFTELGISQQILDVLKKLKITSPTPVQEKSIPIVLAGHDLIAVAQTGTGKTLSFILPIIEKLYAEEKTKKDKRGKEALIVVPTREIALQVEETASSILRHLKGTIRSTALIGGADMFRQITKLKAKPQIIVATPGRLQDHINRRTYNLDNVDQLVLDEADRMFDMGFAPQIKIFMDLIPEQRQIQLFSATMPDSIAALVKKYLKEPKKVQVTPPGSTVKAITQEVCYLKQERKFDVLKKILTDTNGKIIVFVKTKRMAAQVTEKLYHSDFSSTEIHSDRSQSQRKRAIDGFKVGKYEILVATDVAARGLDIDDVQLVVNYDLPMNFEDYTHRIGRTGRAGKLGKSITFAAPREVGFINIVQKQTGASIQLSSFSEESAAERGGRSEGGSNSKRSHGRSSNSRGRSSYGASRGSYSDSRSDRNARPERSDRGERTSRPERSERFDRSDRAEVSSRPEGRNKRPANTGKRIFSDKIIKENIENRREGRDGGNERRERRPFVKPETSRGGASRRPQNRRPF